MALRERPIDIPTTKHRKGTGRGRSSEGKPAARFFNHRMEQEYDETSHSISLLGIVFYLLEHLLEYDETR